MQRDEDDRCMASIIHMRRVGPWNTSHDVQRLLDNLEIRIREARQMRDKISLVEHLNKVYGEAGPFERHCEDFEKPFWEYYEDAIRDPEPVTP
jgi:hypothetical protein